jgi:hypothetical protein
MELLKLQILICLVFPLLAKPGNITYEFLDEAIPSNLNKTAHDEYLKSIHFFENEENGKVRELKILTLIEELNFKL